VTDLTSMDAAFEGLDLFADTAVGDVRDPYPDYARSRREAPVAPVVHFGNEGIGVYRYSDVETVVTDNATFSSSIYGEDVGLVFGPTILQMDGREHQEHRALVAHAFRRKVLEAWRTSQIEPTAAELVDRFAPEGRADLVRELAFQLPIRIIARILGIPSDDYGRFARLSIDMISIAVDPVRGIAASQELGRYFGELIAERRAEPQADLISELVHAEIEGVALPHEEVLGFLRLLLPAGAETTFRLLGNLLFGLLSDPGQLEAVLADRSQIAPAIEEALRWEAPVQFVARTTAAPVSLGGVDIAEGARLTAFLGSANRDESVYEDPDRFDLRREGPPHLAFGGGHHYCLGAHLGRLETTVALNALFDRVPDLALDPDADDPHVHGYAFRSPTSLPVVFSAG
jgi:cytochrome P450